MIRFAACMFALCLAMAPAGAAGVEETACSAAEAIEADTVQTSGVPDTKQGTVTYVDGQLKRKAAQAPLWTSAPELSPVVAGDRVRTLRRSRAELELVESGVIRLAPTTTIDILKLEQESKLKATEAAVRLEDGDIWANVDPVRADASFDIYTPIAAAAITGTVLRMTATADTARGANVLNCWVYQGDIAVTPLKPDGVGMEDTTFTVHAGEEFTLVRAFEEYRRKEEKAFREFQEQQREGFEAYKRRQEEDFKQFKSFGYQLRELDLAKQLQMGWVRWNLMRDDKLR